MSHFRSLIAPNTPTAAIAMIITIRYINGKPSSSIGTGVNVVLGVVGAAGVGAGVGLKLGLGEGLGVGSGCSGVTVNAYIVFR